MTFDEFPNKTNREEQWRLIKDHKPWTRKQLRIWEHYFKTGEFSGDRVVQAEWIMLFHPVKALDVWQSAIDEYWDFNEKRVGEISNTGILTKIRWCHFHPEDHAWIFTLLHGEVYDESRGFPITFPGKEVEVNLESLLVPVFYPLRKYFRGRSETCFVGYIFDYLVSMMGYIPLSAYVCEDDRNPHYVVRLAVESAQECASKSLESATEEERKRILFAQKVNALFEQYRPKD